MSSKLSYVFFVFISIMSSISFGINGYTGFNINEDGADYVAGNVNGQGSSVDDWAGAWTASISSTDPSFIFDVISGGSEGVAGDQCLAMVGSTSGVHNLTRTMDAWSGDFEWSFDVKISSTSLGATCQQQLEGGPGGVGDLRPLNIKWEPGGNFRVNDTVMIGNFGNPGNGFLSMTGGEWVHIKIVCYWDAAQFDLYWEKTDGSMGLVGSKVGYKDAGFVNSYQVSTFKINAPKYADMWVDNISFTPLTMLTAGTPFPSDGALGAAWETDLNWSAGPYALSHDVYFGTDESAVMNAQRLLGDINGDGPADILDLEILADQWLTNPGEVNPSADIVLNSMVDLNDFAALAADWGTTPDPEFKGNQTATTYDLGVLPTETTYYWRIDEINASNPDSPWTGNVWSFTTATNNPFTISDINRTGYTVQYDSLSVGQLLYIDRTYTFTDVGSFSGANYIKTANNDKQATDNSFLTFTVNADAVVYVAHDDRIETKPSWLSSFIDIGENLVSSDGNKQFSLYRKEFEAGTVVIGGNSGEVSGSMYSVIAEPAPMNSPTQASAPDAADGATGVSVTPSLTWTIGDGALSHDVYFGTTNPPAFQGNQYSNTYLPMQVLNPNTTYYWRVDEKNSLGMAQGTVWSFTTGDESTATVLWANDDCAVIDGVNRNNDDDYGLFIKYINFISYIEFTFNTTPVNQATLNLWLVEGAENLYEVTVSGTEYDFDETTFTGTGTPGWTVAGTFSVQTAPKYVTVDITNFYNNNLGKTMTLQVRSDYYPGGTGMFFADHEGTRVDCELKDGPRIDLQ